jgi:hypothetical protein
MMSIYFLGPVRNIRSKRKRLIHLLDIVITNITNEDIDVLIQGAGKVKNNNQHLFQFLNNIPSNSHPNSILTINNQNVKCDFFTVQIATTSISSNAVNISIIGKNQNGNIVNDFTKDVRVIE